MILPSQETEYKYLYVRGDTGTDTYRTNELQQDDVIDGVKHHYAYWSFQFEKEHADELFKKICSYLDHESMQMLTIYIETNHKYFEMFGGKKNRIVNVRLYHHWCDRNGDDDFRIDDCVDFIESFYRKSFRNPNPIGTNLVCNFHGMAIFIENRDELNTHTLKLLHSKDVWKYRYKYYIDKYDQEEHMKDLQRKELKSKNKRVRCVYCDKMLYKSSIKTHLFNQHEISLLS